MNVLLTGSSGFVGRALGPMLLDRGLTLYPVLRSGRALDGNAYSKARYVESLDSNTDWSNQLESIDVVIHLAALVHIMKKSGDGDLSRYRTVNVDGTRNLAMQAASSGVKRFIFLSTVKVNGEFTTSRPFTTDQTEKPEGPYAQSKWEAEQALRTVGNDTGMEIVIIRPPLVYGPGAKGNLLVLSNAIKKGIPLPLGSIVNLRDLVSIYNLCDLVIHCIDCPRAANETFLVSDGESISTPQIVRYLAQGAGQQAELFSVPIWVLRMIAKLAGKTEQFERIAGSLQVDITRTKNLLGWSPPLTVEQSFAAMFESSSRA